MCCTLKVLCAWYTTGGLPMLPQVLLQGNTFAQSNKLKVPSSFCILSIYLFLWGLADNFLESILSFYHVNSWCWTQVLRLGNKCLNILNHLTCLLPEFSGRPNGRQSPLGRFWGALLLSLSVTREACGSKQLQIVLLEEKFCRRVERHWALPEQLEITVSWALLLIQIVRITRP